MHEISAKLSKKKNTMFKTKPGAWLKNWFNCIGKHPTAINPNYPLNGHLQKYFMYENKIVYVLSLLLLQI